jgi:hypothetical protein
MTGLAPQQSQWPPQSQGPQQGQWPPPAGWAAGVPPVRRSGLPRWLIVLIASCVVLFSTMILAAIAIPVFLSQRLKAEHRATTVQLPATFAGHKRNTGAEADALAKTFTVGQIRAEDIAVYGKIGPEVVIIVALKPPTAWSEVRQASERSDFVRSFTAQGTSLVLLEDPDPGELGGWIGCGTAGEGFEVCLATSTGSMVTMISSAGGDDPVTLLRQARAATVHRS